MDLVHIEILQQSFPLAFDPSLPQPIRVDCKIGWFPILQTLCSLLHQRNGRAGVEQVYIARVLEKFGSLRVLARGSSAEVDAWIDFAHSHSMLVCELCSGTGKLSARDGWQRVRCEDHWDVQPTPEEAELTPPILERSWRVQCQDPSDGSGDVILALPDEVLAILGIGLDDKLEVEGKNGKLVLKPVPLGRSTT